MLWDTHMHTLFSGDSTARMKDMIEASAGKHLGGICFTDHLDLDYKEEPGLFDLNIPAYQAGARLYAHLSRLPVCWGIEIGLQPYLADRNNDVIRRYPFDFVIGSTHVVDGIDPYYPSYFENRSEAEGYRAYFEATLANIRSGSDFDVYGHLDYIVRYGPNKNRYYSYEKYRDVIDEILKLLIEKGRGIEVNTAGLKYGLGHPHPLPEILKRYRELGGEILTIGSDAHKPEHVAYDFEKLPDLLESCGFLYFTVFRDRKPEFHKIKSDG